MMEWKTISATRVNFAELDFVFADMDSNISKNGWVKMLE